MKIIQKEFMIMVSTFIFCYIAYKFNSYDVMTIYLLVRIWIEKRLYESDDQE